MNGSQTRSRFHYKGAARYGSAGYLATSWSSGKSNVSVNASFGECASLALGKPRDSTPVRLSSDRESLPSRQPNEEDKRGARHVDRLHSRPSANATTIQQGNVVQGRLFAHWQGTYGTVWCTAKRSRSLLCGPSSRGSPPLPSRRRPSGQSPEASPASSPSLLSRVSISLDGPRRQLEGVVAVVSERTREKQKNAMAFF